MLQISFHKKAPVSDNTTSTQIKFSFPKFWKNATIISIKKPNQTSTFSTSQTDTYEGFWIYKQKNNSWLIRIQTETLHEIARITDHITTNSKLNIVTSLLTIDVEKAFDTIWHQSLICKLLKQGLPVYIIKIILLYFTERTFQTKVKEILFQKYPIRAGPQGDIPSPIYLHTTLTTYKDKAAKNSFIHRRYGNYIWIISIKPSKQIQIHVGILEKHLNGELNLTQRRQNKLTSHIKTKQNGQKT